MDYAFLEHAEDYLPRTGGHVLGLTGTGAVSGLMEELAGFYRRLSVPVIMTGTVGSEPAPGSVPVIWSESGALPADPVLQVTAGGGRGLPAQVIDDLAQRHPERIILCLNDEPSSLPLKLYGPEPVIWPRLTSLALVLMAGEAVGSQARAVVQGQGDPGVLPRVVADLGGHELLLWEHMDELLLGPGGYLDQVPQDVPVVLALTGMEEIADSIGLFGFTGRVMNHPRLPLVMFCSRGEDGWRLRTAFRTDQEDPGI